MRILVATVIALSGLGIQPGLAQSPAELLENSAALGTLVGQAVQCGVDPAQVRQYVSRTVPTEMPETADPVLNAQMNQAFEQAMRSAVAPDQGCDPVVQRMQAPQ